jgi:hypothetical protein
VPLCAAAGNSSDVSRRWVGAGRAGLSEGEGMPLTGLSMFLPMSAVCGECPS